MNERENGSEQESFSNDVRVIIPSARCSKFIIVDLRQSNESQRLFKVEDWRNHLSVVDESFFYRQIATPQFNAHAYTMLGELASKMVFETRPELTAPIEVSIKVEGGLLDLRPFPDESWHMLLDELCEYFDGKKVYQAFRKILDADRKEFFGQLYGGKDGHIFMNIWQNPKSQRRK